MRTILSNPVCLYQPGSINFSLFLRQCSQTELNIPSLRRHVTDATTTRACRESKCCMTPCKCRRSTAHTKMRATSGYRNSSALTLKTSLTQSFWTLPIKSTRGINKQGWELAMSRSACFLCFISQGQRLVRWCRQEMAPLFVNVSGQLHTGNLWNPAQNNFVTVDTILNIFFTLDVNLSQQVSILELMNTSITVHLSWQFLPGFVAV